MAGIEKVPDHLSVVGVYIDLGRAKPSDIELLFRDMGMGDPLPTGRTIEDRVDLSPEARRALQGNDAGPEQGYNPTYRPK